MILAVDIGNSTVSFALTANKRILFKSSILSSCWEPGLFRKALDKFIVQSKVPVDSIENAVISCVVPNLLNPVLNAVKTLLSRPAFVVQPGIRIGMRIMYQPVASIGSDRIVNAFATRKIYGYPSVCIDFGTATTFNVINSKGDFQGGLILPGVQSFSRLLSQTTAQLPLTVFTAPTSVIEQSTETNIRSGTVYGYVSMIEGLLQRIRHELNYDFITVATGGSHTLFKNITRSISIFDENLLFKGLELLCKHNLDGLDDRRWE